ncbi:MAG: PilC/PilY family type IV pilus protein [Steroidobacteraceae bacterium]
MTGLQPTIMRGAACPAVMRLAATVLGCLAGAAAYADDTEIFVNQAMGGGANPNVLLIFDTSGSMTTSVTLPKAPYDPAVVYAGSCNASETYWTLSTAAAPPSCSDATAARFESNVNRCRAAIDGIAAAGLWTGRVAQWDSAQTQWLALRSSATDSDIECAADAGTHGESDGSSERYARNGDDNSRWTSQPLQQISWTNASVYRLYSANWLNWNESAPQPATATRLQTVQAAARSLINSLDGVNIGLMRFSNDPDSATDLAAGGMVVHEIADISQTRTSLTNAINSLTAEGQTPLSETLYEAQRYFSGSPVDFGLNSRIDINTPFPSIPASRRSTDQTRYESPIKAQCQRNFVVMLTDGEPTFDNAADASIESLPGFASVVGSSSCDDSGDGRCLDDLAQYMREADQSPLPGEQTVTTYTVGFGAAAAGSPFLAKTATRGGGQSFAANDIVDLSNSLQAIFANILRVNTTFTTPAVSLNAFNRTQTLNQLYVSVFKPSDTLRWQGNLKRYGISNGVIVDAQGNPAIDPATGFFRNNARSFWSSSVDGNDTEAGGAVEQLPDPAQRKLYTYIAAAGNSSLAASVNQLQTGNALLTDTLLGTGGSGPARDDVINFARGFDVYDQNFNGSTTDARPSMGDPLHARPALAIYGGSPAAPDSNDAVIYVPTNDGFLHAVDARTGAELWAFVPPELLPRLSDLYRNPGVVARTYGLDSDVRILKFDANLDGVIDAGAGDRMFIYFGMRRGGRNVYALDVTNRSQPRLLWSGGPAQFPGIGETWSVPTITRVRVSGAAQNGENLVLIFGGGYDDAQENYAYTPDSSGRRIYFVDALTGQLLWAGGNSSGGPIDLALPNMVNSIPARITVVDSNADQYADRLYAADMGGQIWRFDIFNGNSRGSLVTGGVIATLGAAGVAGATSEDVRRFYNAPDVALIQRRGADPYFNIAIGSGYRGHPLDTAVHDRFYSVRDKNPFGKLSQAQYNAIVPLTDNDLVDITPNITATAVNTNANGWKLELQLNGGWIGEKVLGEALTVDGVILFPTYQPLPPSQQDPCVPANGVNRVYALSVDTGRPAIDFNDDLAIDASDASTQLVQTGIAGEISLIYESVLGSQGSGGGGNGGSGGDGVDAAGRRVICASGVEVLNRCVVPQGVVRTFWQRPGIAGN